MQRIWYNQKKYESIQFINTFSRFRKPTDTQMNVLYLKRVIN